MGANINKIEERAYLNRVMGAIFRKIVQHPYIGGKRPQIWGKGQYFSYKGAVFSILGSDIPHGEWHCSHTDVGVTCA